MKRCTATRWCLPRTGVRPQPSVAEWLELEVRGVISRDELRQQLAISAAPGQVNPVGQGALP